MRVPVRKRTWLPVLVTSLVVCWAVGLGSSFARVRVHGERTRRNCLVLLSSSLHVLVSEVSCRSLIVADSVRGPSFADIAPLLALPSRPRCQRRTPSRQ